MKLQANGVAACVILYNSTIDCLARIESYRQQVALVYVIDNSDHGNEALIAALKQLANVRYLANEGNQGVAFALNRAAKLALDDQFDYLLTMDDDTKLPPDSVEKMLAFTGEQLTNRPIGIVSGIHTKSEVEAPFRYVPYTMTSGNLLNLQAYRQVGPFSDDLFIDHVDHEYGFRLNRAGYAVVELTGLRLDHRLGQRKRAILDAFTFISHTPSRTYYIVRNGWVVARKFPEFRLRAAQLIGKEWLKLVFLENQKLRRLQLFWRGTVDGYRGRLGKLSG